MNEEGSRQDKSATMTPRFLTSSASRGSSACSSRTVAPPVCHRSSSVHSSRFAIHAGWISLLSRAGSSSTSTRKPSVSLIASNRRISGREQYQAERTADSSVLTLYYSTKGEFISKSTADGHLYPGTKRSP